MTINSGYKWSIESSINGFQLVGFTLLFLAVISAISIALYRLLKVRKKIIATRADLLQLFDNDRATLSQELHDVVGSFLIPLKSETEKMAELEKATWEERINTFEKFIKQTSKTIYPEYIYNGDLTCSLKKLTGFLSTHSTKVLVYITDDIAIEKDRGNQCFKLLLELITNVIKYDKPENLVLVTINEKNTLVITLNYTSNTHNRLDISKNKGLGLRIIEQRLLLINGKLIRYQTGNEYQIKLSVPFSQ